MANRARFNLLLASLGVLAATLWGCSTDNNGYLMPDGATGGDDAYVPFCGNGMKDPGEQCDNGTKNGKGAGCEPDCQFTCSPGDTKCDDGDPCNGMETCLPAHTCQAGTPLGDGMACGMNKICRKMVCGDVMCGDGITSAGEECDSGMANGPNTGCETNCKFSCVSTDAMRNCAPADPCAGQGKCSDMTHACAAGTPLADNTPCGMNKVCLKGVCQSSLCGNGMVDMGEQCDDANKMNGDGCDNDCRFSCANAATDCPLRAMSAMAPVCETWTCDMAHKCQTAVDAAQDGKACGMNLICKAGACISPNAVCGNGVKEPGEDCDFGMANGPNSGCEKNCKFSCVTMPKDSCVSMNPCVQNGMCMPVNVNNQMGQKCSVGMNQPDGTVCAMASICLAGTCKLSMCGDGYVDMAAGETCEPPNSMTCDAMCHVKAVCGNGKREGGEQCDDSNKVNLDGCNATCQFEQDQRINWLKMQFGTDQTCTKNALGGAIVSNLAQGPLQMSIDTAVGNGGISILFVALGITDLSGMKEPSFKIGVVNGKVVMGMNYNGAADLDWWYTSDVMGLDNARAPLNQLPASILNGALTAGPGTVTLNLVLGGMPTAFKMSGVNVTATVNASSLPLVSMNMMTPGHLAAENLDPKLQSYASTGQQNANGAAKLCGNVSGTSLSQVVVPAQIPMNCPGYTVKSTMLDLLIGGCTAFGFIQLVKPTQPDGSDPKAPLAGAGPPYTLSANGMKQVTTCKDKGGMVVNLATCLDSLSYSSFFKFTSDRVIAK